MAILPHSLDYTDRDFDAIRLRLQSLIRSVFPTWTDFNVANFGDILLELFGFVQDVLGYYQDNQARESRIVTATQRKNLIGLAKLIGFKPEGASAATTDETFTLASPPVGSVTIPAGTQCSTADITTPISFQLLSAVVFAPSATSAVGTVENSETQTDVFTSSGLPNQSFVLPSTPYLDGSAVPVASDGTYTEVDNFLDSASSDKNFTTVVDQNDQVTLTFGDGVSGKIPVGTITVTSKTGGGSAANVDPGTITQIPGTFTDSFGNPVQVSCTNPSKASDGTERATVAQIQSSAPQSVRVLTRAVAREDFEIVSMKVAGVVRSLMTTSNEDAAVPENTGNLYIVPTGAGVPSTTLKALVLSQFQAPPPPGMTNVPFPKTLTFKVNVLNPQYLATNVFAVVYFQKGVVPAAGALAVRSALANFFSPTIPLLNVDGSTNPLAGTVNKEIDFGLNYVDSNGVPTGFFPLDKVFTLIAELPQIRQVGGQASSFLLNNAHADVAMTVRDFPKLGTVTLVDGTTGGLI